MAIADYSTSAGDNASQGWAEGQMPSSVNDGVRNVLASLRLAANDASWIDYRDGTPDGTYTYISAGSFKVSGEDSTAKYAADVRVRAVGTSTGTIYGTIDSSSYSAPDTTVLVTWGSGSLSNEALAICISVVEPMAIPVAALPDLSLGTSGFYTLPGGLLVQWGIDTTLTHGRTVTFPEPFPTACYVVIPSVKYGGGGVTTDTHVGYGDVTTTTFKQVAYDTSGGQVTADPLGDYTYIAIGA